MSPLRLEHIALNVADAAQVAAWYGQHLGMRVVRAGSDPARTTFLITANGAILLEIYNNTTAPVPPYAAMHPLELHLAFNSDDPHTDAARLVRAGATVAEAFKTTPAGDRMIMLRDPFGLGLQLVWRSQPMLP